MKNKKKQQMGMNVGTSLILVAFVLLCLVAFAALSYSSAFSDFKLSTQAAQRKQEYYNASNTAQQKISEIDNALIEAYQTTSSQSSYYQELEKNFSKTEYQLENNADGAQISFCIPINDKQALQVSLLLNYPSQTDTSYLYQIAEYRTIRQHEKENENLIIENGGLLF